MRDLICLPLTVAMLSTCAAMAADTNVNTTNTVPSNVTTTAATSPVAPPLVPQAPACCVLPVGYIINLEVLDPLDSKTSIPGDKFAIRLADAVKINGVEVLPAGLTGEGEVVHAAKARAMGKAGEMIIAARYIMFNDLRIPLKGMQLGGVGKDNRGTAMAASMVLTPAVFFISGGEMRIPAKTSAFAKIAVAQTLSPQPAEIASAPAVTTAIEPTSTDKNVTGDQ